MGSAKTVQLYSTRPGSQLLVLSSRSKQALKFWHTSCAFSLYLEFPTTSQTNPSSSSMTGNISKQNKPLASKASHQRGERKLWVLLYCKLTAVAGHSPHAPSMWANGPQKWKFDAYRKHWERQKEAHPAGGCSKAQCLLCAVSWQQQILRCLMPGSCSGMPCWAVSTAGPAFPSKGKAGQMWLINRPNHHRKALRH